MTTRSRKIALWSAGLALALIGLLGLAQTTSASDSPSSACTAEARTLSQARQAYARACDGQPRVDCDPMGGVWRCSSEQIGDAAPGRPATVRPAPATTSPAPGTIRVPSSTPKEPSTSTTEAPTAPRPTTKPPATQAPATTASTAPASSVAPTTKPPTTQAPTTRPPTTQAPTTQAPTTRPPTTQPPATQAPTTQPPTTQPAGHNQGGGHGGGNAPTPFLPNGFPRGVTGSSALEIINKAPDTRPIPPNIATFRMDCHYSHMNFDDAIVHPGQPGAAHLHVYYGNTTVDANTDPMTLSESGNSTCAGGRANRSAYWVPAVIDTNNGDRVLEPDGSVIYYKLGWQGGKPQDVTAPPNGLRVVAGDQGNSVRTSDRYWERNINWACTRKGQIDNQRLSAAIPTDCRPGELLLLRVSFPQCWDGRNLDSPNHRSHMAYLSGSPNNRQDCPASHPVLIPRMSINAYFKLNSTDTSGLRLSSDGYERSKPGGLSAHADWIVGWDQQLFQRMLNGCFLPADDCGHNNFNDGQALRFPRR